MKKILQIGLLAMIAMTTQAQEQPEENTQAQERIRNLQIAYISDKVGLTTEQAEKFWPVYREFSARRSALRQELNNERERLENQETPENKEELVQLGLAIRQQELDLEKDYANRLLNVINAQQVLDLRQAERDFQRMILNQLQQRRMIQQRRENLRDNQQLRQQQRN